LADIKLSKGIGKKARALKQKVKKPRKASADHRINALRKQINKTQQRVEEIEDEY
jgi:hypothetical protein